MDEDYESAKKLLEDLRKKYSTKSDLHSSFLENNNKNIYNCRNKASTSNTATLDQLKYSTKNVPEGGNKRKGSNIVEPSVSNTQAKNKRQSKSKGDGTNVKLAKKDSSINNKSEVVTALIDTNITRKSGPDIAEKLQEAQIFYKFTDQVYPGSVTWTRSCAQQDINNQEDTKEAILIIDWKDVVSYIKSSKFVSHIKYLQEILSDKRIFLGLYGLSNYFRYWKTQAAGNISKAEEKKLAEYKNCTKISRSDFENALTEVQLACNCCYRLLNSPQDVVDLILQFTKSITQLPEKLEKREKYKDYEWHMLKDNRDCVAVDKNGNGLQRLWQQQLTTFELARLETAEAVMAQYATPSKLYDAYQQCSESEGQKLLEDILIRRSAGPLTSSRKVGPELSSKIYTFFNSTDGNSVL